VCKSRIQFLRFTAVATPLAVFNITIPETRIPGSDSGNASDASDTGQCKMKPKEREREIFTFRMIKVILIQKLNKQIL
jgi:hypothetical protein